MDTEQHEPREGEVPDPELVEAIRAAIKSVAGAVTPVDTQSAALEEARTPLILSCVNWAWKTLLQIGLPVFVAVVAIGGVFVYMQLSSAFGETRDDLSRMRRELALVRNGPLRKDEFNNRTGAASTLVREADVNSKTTNEGTLQKLEDQKQTLNDLNAQLKELRREIDLLQKRLPTRDKPSVPKAAE